MSAVLTRSVVGWFAECCAWLGGVALVGTLTSCKAPDDAGLFQRRPAPTSSGAGGSGGAEDKAADAGSEPLLDAGPSSEDQLAREAQVDQLVEAIAQRSAGRPILLAGDTNLRAPRDLLRRFEQATGLVDVCEALRCPDARRIDRVLFRSSPALTIRPRKWSIDRRFTDAKGQPLSDHLAVSVELDWKSYAPGSR